MTSGKGNARSGSITRLTNLPNVDVHGILFAVVAVVFVVYPLIQWALGR